MVKYCVAVFSCCVLLCAGVNSECGENEEMQCVHSCPPQKTCRDRDIPVYCTRVFGPCTSRCVCKPGYIRNENNECISEDQCEICEKENEFYDCDVPCDNVCESLTVRNRTSCDLYSYKCIRQCYCKDGYARDSNRNCIPIDECPEMPRDEN